MRYEYVQAPIQAVVVNLLPVQPEQVSQSAVLIPALSHLPAFVATKPCDGEHAGDQRPGNRFAATGHQFFEDTVQAKTPP